MRNCSRWITDIYICVFLHGTALDFILINVQGCPPSFREIKQRISKLGFKDEPAYMEYKLLMLRDIRNAGGHLDSKFEWEERGQRDNKWQQKATTKPSQDQEAKREVGFFRYSSVWFELTGSNQDFFFQPGDTDTIRTIDSITNNEGISKSNAKSGSMGIEDTLEDIPDEKEMFTSKSQGKKDVAAE